MSTRTYYRGPDAVVTDTLVVWHTTPARGFAVRELRNICLVRRDVGPRRPHAVHLLGGALIILAATWTTLTTSAAILLGLFAVAVPATVAAVRRRPRRLEMHASYRGHDVIVYASSEPRVFNQVARAVRRAVEDARPPTSHYELAS